MVVSGIKPASNGHPHSFLKRWFYIKYRVVFTATACLTFVSIHEIDDNHSSRRYVNCQNLGALFFSANILMGNLLLITYVKSILLDFAIIIFNNLMVKLVSCLDSYNVQVLDYLHVFLCINTRNYCTIALNIYTLLFKQSNISSKYWSFVAFTILNCMRSVIINTLGEIYWLCIMINNFGRWSVFVYKYVGFWLVPSNLTIILP